MLLQADDGEVDAPLPNAREWFGLLKSIAERLRGVSLYLFGTQLVFIFALMLVPRCLKGVVSEPYIFATIVIMALIVVLSMCVVIVDINSKKKR